MQLQAAVVEAPASTQTEEGVRLVEAVRSYGVQPGEERHDSWVKRGSTSTEPMIAHNDSLGEFNKSQMERLINY